MVWKCWVPNKIKPFHGWLRVSAYSGTKLKAENKHYWSKTHQKQKVIDAFNALWPSSSGEASKGPFPQFLLIISTVTGFRLDKSRQLSSSGFAADKNRLWEPVTMIGIYRDTLAVPMSCSCRPNLNAQGIIDANMPNPQKREVPICQCTTQNPHRTLKTKIP